MVARRVPVAKLGIGLIGAGVVGQLRARVVAQSARARLLGVADPDQPLAARAVGTSKEVARVVDYRALLDNPAVEAVIVATPAHLHRQMVVDALQAGKHVLCEKPLATTFTDCQELVQMADHLGLLLAVGFNHRYFPCIQFLKSALERGTLGQLLHLRALAGHRGLSEFRADWMYRQPMSGGGAMMDIGLHLTDLVGFLAGPIRQVYGSCSEQLWQLQGSEDSAVALLTTAAGLPVSYHATWGEWKGYRLILEAYGSEGLIRAFYAPMLNLQVLRKGAPRWKLYPWINLREKLWGWETTAQCAFAEEFEDFLGALQGNWGRLADGRAGLQAVQVATAVYQSSRSGLPVSLEE